MKRCDCASSQASGRGSGTWEQSCPPEESSQAQPWEKPQLTHKRTCASAYLQTCQQLYITEVVWLLYIFIVRIPNNAPHSSNNWGSLGAWGGWKYHLFSLCHPSSFQTFTTSHSSDFHVPNFSNISHSFSPSQSLISFQFLSSLLYCRFGWLFQCWGNEMNPCLIRSTSFLKHSALSMTVAMLLFTKQIFICFYKQPSQLILSRFWPRWLVLADQMWVEMIYTIARFFLFLLPDVWYIDSHYWSLDYRLSKGIFGCAGKGMNILHACIMRFCICSFLGKKK